MTSCHMTVSQSRHMTTCHNSFIVDTLVVDAELPIAA